MKYVSLFAACALTAMHANAVNCVVDPISKKVVGKEVASIDRPLAWKDPVTNIVQWRSQGEEVVTVAATSHCNSPEMQAGREAAFAAVDGKAPYVIGPDGMKRVEYKAQPVTVSAALTATVLDAPDTRQVKMVGLPEKVDTKPARTSLPVKHDSTQVKPSSTVQAVPAVSPTPVVSPVTTPSIKPQTEAPSVAKTLPVTPLVKTWEILPQDISIYSALKRWSQEAGWQLSWEIPIDYPVTIAGSVKGDFEQAIDQVFTSYEDADYPPKGCLYSNKVVRVVRRVGDGNECTK